MVEGDSVEIIRDVRLRARAAPLAVYHSSSSSRARRKRNKERGAGVVRGWSRLWLLIELLRVSFVFVCLLVLRFHRSRAASEKKDGHQVQANIV